jgi:hypothetical protein
MDFELQKAKFTSFNFLLVKTETENTPKHNAKARDTEIYVELYLIWRFKCTVLKEITTAP